MARDVGVEEENASLLASFLEPDVPHPVTNAEDEE